MSYQPSPAPWKVQRLRNTIGRNNGTHPVVNGWRCIAHVYDRSPEEHEANARLIAASPELLAKLRAVTDMLIHVAKVRGGIDVDGLDAEIIEASALLGRVGGA